MVSYQILLLVLAVTPTFKCEDVEPTRRNISLEDGDMASRRYANSDNPRRFNGRVGPNVAPNRRFASAGSDNPRRSIDGLGSDVAASRRFASAGSDNPRRSINGLESDVAQSRRFASAGSDNPRRSIDGLGSDVAATRRTAKEVAAADDSDLTRRLLLIAADGEDLKLNINKGNGDENEITEIYDDYPNYDRLDDYYGRRCIFDACTEDEPEKSDDENYERRRGILNASRYGRHGILNGPRYKTEEGEHKATEDEERIPIKDNELQSAKGVDGRRGALHTSKYGRRGILNASRYGRHGILKASRYGRRGILNEPRYKTEEDEHKATGDEERIPTENNELQSAKDVDGRRGTSHASKYGRRGILNASRYGRRGILNGPRYKTEEDEHKVTEDEERIPIEDNEHQSAKDVDGRRETLHASKHGRRGILNASRYGRRGILNGPRYKTEEDEHKATEDEERIPIKDNELQSAKDVDGKRGALHTSKYGRRGILNASRYGRHGILKASPYRRRGRLSRSRYETEEDEHNATEDEECIPIEDNELQSAKGVHGKRGILNASRYGRRGILNPSRYERRGILNKPRYKTEEDEHKATEDEDRIPIEDNELQSAKDVDGRRGILNSSRYGRRGILNSSRYGKRGILNGPKYETEEDKATEEEERIPPKDVDGRRGTLHASRYRKRGILKASRYGRRGILKGSRYETEKDEHEAAEDGDERRGTLHPSKYGRHGILNALRCL